MQAIDSDYKTPEEFFRQYTNNTLAKNSFAVQKNLTYYSGPKESLTSYLGDFIATHDKILTPFSKSLNKLLYTTNAGLENHHKKSMQTSEHILSYFRGHKLNTEVLEDIYKLSMLNPHQPEIHNTGPSFSTAQKIVHDLPSQQARQTWYANMYHQELEKYLQATNQRILILIDAKPNKKIQQVLEKHLFAA